MRSINFENCKQTAVICLQIVRKRDDIMLTNVKYVDCINIHFRPHFCIFMQKCPRVILHAAASCEHLLAFSFKFTVYTLLYIVPYYIYRERGLCPHPCVMVQACFFCFFLSNAIFLPHLHLFCVKNSKFANIII